MKRLTILAAAALAAGVMCSELSAQQTSTGAFGERTTGGTGGVSAPRGGSSSNSSGTSSIGGGSGGSLLQDITGQSQENARYTRNARSQGNQFVGQGSEDARAVGVVQAAGAGGAGGGRGGGQQGASLFGGQNGNLLGQLMSGQFNQGGNQRTRSSNAQLRIPIRMDFNPTPVATTQFTGQFQKRLGKLPGLTTVGPIEILVEGETVVLRGVVASEGDRQLAADLAKLQPEVSLVRNELTVQTPVESSGAAQPVPTTVTP